MLQAHDTGSGRRCRVPLLTVPLVVAALTVSAAPELEEIVVRAEASVVAMRGEAGSVTTVDAAAVGLTRAESRKRSHGAGSRACGFRAAPARST